MGVPPDFWADQLERWRHMTVESARSLSFRWLRLLLPDPRPAPGDTKQEKREVLLLWGIGLTVATRAMLVQMYQIYGSMSSV